MKAITLWQPWASLIAIGAKKYETRSWPTNYRGLLAIHAAAKAPKTEMELCEIEPFKSSLRRAGIISANELPLGSVIAIANLVDCIYISKEFIKAILDTVEYGFGDYEISRYAWKLEGVRPINPIPAKGMQRIWEWMDANNNN